jgi:hypothetical protein
MSVNQTAYITAQGVKPAKSRLSGRDVRQSGTGGYVLVGMGESLAKTFTTRAAAIKYAAGERAQGVLGSGAVMKGSRGLRVWVDDNRAAPEGWVWVQTAEQAKIRLLQHNVEEMSLDFDLDNPACPTCDFKCGYRDEGACSKGCHCHTAGDQTGADLVRWMVEWNVWPKGRPVVHSINGRGAEEMKQLIDDNFSG